jgi:peptide/nickel transport system permease protein
MRLYIAFRTLPLLPTLLGSNVAVFLLARLVPGTIVDQLIGTENAYSPETVKALRAFFAMDAPLHVQYGR